MPDKMKRGGLSWRRKLLAAMACIVAVTFLLPAAASAQQIKPLDVEQDPNGVDLLRGKVSSRIPALSIPAAPNLSFNKLTDYLPMLQGELIAGAMDGRQSYSVNAGAIASDSFSCTEQCVGSKGSGGVLFGHPTSGVLHYTQGGTGIKIRFDILNYLQDPPAGGQKFYYLASKVTYPNGEVLTFSYASGNPDPSLNYLVHRPTQVSSNLGYQLKFTYRSSNVNSSNWYLLQKAEILKSSAPSAPLARYIYTDTTVTDLDGRVFNCTNCVNGMNGPNPDYVTSLKLPGETLNTFDASWTDTAPGHDLAIMQDGVSYDYVFDYEAGYPEGVNNVVDDVTITGPAGFYRYVDIENINQSSTSGYAPPRQRIKSITNSQGQVTSYEYDTLNRVTKAIQPELNSVEVEYDTSGNITKMTTTPKPGSGQAALVQEAYYDSGFECASYSCFVPEWTKDAKGNQTDYTWSNQYGGLLTQLDPVNAQGKRRKVKNSYTQAAGGVWRLTGEEICEADSSGAELTCGTANSYLRTITYWEDTLLPLTQTVSDGLGGDPLTTTNSYDNAGRLTSTDGPLPGSDDATYARYDILGRKIWEIGPKGENDLRPATRTTYREADSQPILVESATVSSPTDTTLSNLVSKVETFYNGRRLATRTWVRDASNTRQSLTQITYDSRNRGLCTAIRMNPANWLGAGSGDACALREDGSSGTDGPDRITRKTYDTESRVIKIQQAYGTTLERDYATYTFTPNGQMASITDARGFKASMLYDGFDRQTHWYFPDPNTTGAINMSDYELYGYDANGNRTSLRKRDGSVITYAYDKLNRVTKKTVPERAGLDPTHTRDVFYRYDIRGLQDIARFDSMSGEGLRTFYDTYGRVTQNYFNMDGTVRNLWYDYDAAGNRIELKYPDSKLVYYDYTSGGQFDRVRDHGGTTIADYQYNARGELDKIDRDSTAPDQTWTYDPIGRLASTGWSTGTQPVTWSFTRNVASQIKTETQTNDAYSWDGLVSGAPQSTTNYTANGLNQYTDVGGNGFCYDANGNLTADGTYVYLYDVENRMVEMRAKASNNCASLAYTGEIKARLTYDPLGRLYETEGFAGGVVSSRRYFLYDGDALVAEYTGSGAMHRRYVHGPGQGVDDPIAEYIGASVAAPNRRNLYADARGSIVLSTNAVGGAPTINTYDPYGVPGSTNAGRFQYTGQIWLEELGMNYYKARMYSPALGRFMQTDPIGYADNVNLYAYTGNDPINMIDPKGTDSCGLRGCPRDHLAATGKYPDWAEVPDGYQPTKLELAFAYTMLGSLVLVTPFDEIGSAVLAVRAAYAARVASRSFSGAMKLSNKLTGGLKKIVKKRETNFHGNIDGGNAAAKKFFNALTRGRSREADGGRVGSLKDGTSVQMGTRTLDDGTKQTSVRITRWVSKLGSRIRRKENIKLRFNEPKE